MISGFLPHGMARPQVADGLEVNADKTKYMVMCRDQNTGRSYSVTMTIAVPFKLWKSPNIWEQC